MCSHAPFQIGPTPYCCWPLGWVIALNLTTHLHCTCPLICIRLGKSFASDLTSTLAGPDWQKSTLNCPSRKAAIGQKEPVEGVQKIRGDSVFCVECPAGDYYLMEVWIVAVFIVFLNE